MEKESIIFQNLETAIYKGSWLKMLIIKLFGKTYYGMDTTENGIYIVTVKSFRGAMYVIKDEYYESSKTKF